MATAQSGHVSGNFFTCPRRAVGTAPCLIALLLDGNNQSHSCNRPSSMSGIAFATSAFTVFE
jgi:hypothetical protein